MRRRWSWNNNEEKLYQCPICEKKYFSKEATDFHLRKKHGTDIHVPWLEGDEEETPPPYQKWKWMTSVGTLMKYETFTSETGKKGIILNPNDERYFRNYLSSTPPFCPLTLFDECWEDVCIWLELPHVENPLKAQLEKYSLKIH